MYLERKERNRTQYKKVRKQNCKQLLRCTDEPSEALPPLENKLQKVSLKNGGLNKVQKAKSKVRPNI